MDGEFDLSVIIPTCPERREKLQALLEGIGKSACDHERFEVVLVVDGEDDGSLSLADELLGDIGFLGLTQPQGGPAKARNLAIGKARGRWLLFFDDDVRVDEETIGRHLQQIRWHPEAEVAHLGRSVWPPEMLNSPWQHLLANTSMIFFWDNIEADRLYGFRYFGLKVNPLPEVISWHDHELSPRDYFFREYRGGRVARIARDLTPEFYNEVWGWMDDLEGAGAVLNRIFKRPAREIRQRLEEWAISLDYCPTEAEMRAMYLAHLPLKRMAFCQGYAGRAFEEIWATNEKEPSLSRSQMSGEKGCGHDLIVSCGGGN